MICEVCKKNRAVVHLINIINGKKRHQMLCEECALKINNIERDYEKEDKKKSKEKGDEINFTKILNGLFDYMSNYEDIESENLICSNCNRTYKEFRETGICSCSECYKIFSEKYDFLEDKKYRGKIPKGKNYFIDKKIKIESLKNELSIYIEEENYEEAAIIRDKIKVIEDQAYSEVGEDD
ncbi:MAG: UvrB/UvrC motif-containing protein [Sarcina sp.]